MTNKPMNEQEKETFVSAREALYAKYRAIGYKPTIAALKAGFASNAAKRVAQKLEKQLSIADLVEEEIQKRGERLDVTADKLARMLIEGIERAAMGKAQYDIGGGFKGFEFDPKHADSMCKMMDKLCDLLGVGYKYEMGDGTEKPMVVINMGEPKNVRTKPVES